MNHTVSKLDGDILALTLQKMLNTKSGIFPPKGIQNYKGSSHFSPRHPHSLLAAEYLIPWHISIINLSNRNNHRKIIQHALIIKISKINQIYTDFC